MHKTKEIIHHITRNTIAILARILHVSLLELAHKEIGILRSGECKTSGEEFFVKKILNEIIKKDNPILIDGGANVGEYSTILRETFPEARIIAFEPNNSSFGKLKKICSKERIEPYEMGLSSSARHTNIFLDNNPESRYASIYETALRDIHNHTLILKKKIQLIDLDTFGKDNDLEFIDFLKLDIEGHEYEALKGAGTLVKDEKIAIVQFEFSAVNIAPRVFLKDFYDLMPRYEFFRIIKNGLHPLGKYNSINEIFRIHNLVAISKQFLSNIDILRFCK